MIMKAYRSYFDHISLSAGQHRRLMDTLDTARRTPRPRRIPILKYAALAACCAFALFAGFRAAGQLGGGSAPGGVGHGPPAGAGPDRRTLSRGPAGGGAAVHPGW